MRRGAAATILFAAALLPASAQAAFPGRNGDLVFVDNSANPSSDIGILYRVRPTGGRARRLRCHVSFSTGCTAQHPVFSPTGRSLAFVNRYSVMLSRPDGRARRRLDTPFSDEQLTWNPAWSPRGRSLLFESQLGSFSNAPDVVVMSARGAGGRILIENGGDPTWSSRGSIAFVRDRNPDRPDEIWVARADGRGQRRVIRGSEPSWSPDGRRIAFSRIGDSTNRLYTVRASGRGLRRLTRLPGLSPVWSPDGRRIAFLRIGRRRSGSRAAARRIYTVRTNGRGLRVVGRAGNIRNLDWQARP